MIKQFNGEYGWLSNFAPLEIGMCHEGITYYTVENFYVAMKTLYKEDRNLISTMSPGKAKRFGAKKITLREDWDKVKLRVMYSGTKFKYSTHNPILRSKLIQTGDLYIQEGNEWGDTYWGVELFTGFGENNLGKMIMRVRKEILNDN